MDEHRRSAIVGWSALVVVCLHFAALFAYASPLKRQLPPAVARVVTGYVHPFFDQTWSMFAPAPVSNRDLRLRAVRADGSPGEWIDPFAAAARSHRRWRAAPGSRLMLGKDNMLAWIQHFLDRGDVSWPLRLSDRQAASFRQQLGYANLRWFVGTLVLRDPALADAAAVEVRVRVEDVERHTRRETTIRLERVELLR